MLKTLKLKNFKSFADTNEIEFAPITILSGQNSSGKSSIIQAVLTLKQTLESPFSEEPIILNGAYVSLGEFDDIKNIKAKSKDQVCFSIELKKPQLNQIYNDFGIKYYMDSDINNVKISINIEKPDPMEEYQTGNSPKLSKTTISGKISENVDDDFILEINSNKSLTSKLSSLFITDGISLNESNKLYNIKKHKGLNPRPEAIKLDKFLPDMLLYAYNKSLQELKNNFLEEFSNNIIKITSVIVNNESDRHKNMTHLYRTIARKLSEKKHVSEKDKVDSQLINEVTSIFDDYVLNGSSGFKWDSQRSYSDIQRYFQRIIINMSEQELIKTKEYINEWLPRFADARIQKKAIETKTVRYLKLVNNDMVDFADINEFITNSFDKTFYLGPLREDPKVFYRRSGSADPMYVGPKGENVAFVLKYYFNRKIITVLPPENEEDDWNPYNLKIEQCTLGKAVTKWLDFMGVAHEIKIEEMGKVGLMIKANINGDKYADLTNVGVGVSQVLPVVVLGLAAPIGSVLIYEQPELHLHPYVQSKLGDFFIALASIKKQVIAETHSEHLILRMRYHIAKRNICTDKDVNIYFVQRNDEIRISEAKKVIIDKFGSIENWPIGFFDETKKQLDNILNAALERDDLF
jgi:predicted ATPase